MTDHRTNVQDADRAATEELLPLLAHRASPAWFDDQETVDDATVDLLLEAARRSPSAGNSQPWAFIVGRRGDSVHSRLCRHLAGGSARWAPQASVLFANLSRVLVEDSDFEFSEFSRCDLGQAVAHMNVQAAACGLDVHQFRAFDRIEIANEFDVP